MNRTSYAMTAAATLVLTLAFASPVIALPSPGAGATAEHPELVRPDLVRPDQVRADQRASDFGLDLRFAPLRSGPLGVPRWPKGPEVLWLAEDARQWDRRSSR